MNVKFYLIGSGPDKDKLLKLSRQLRLRVFDQDYDTITEQFDTLFIGGGTPSLIQPLQLELILKSISEKIEFSALTEITMEVNPGEAP